MPLLDAAPLAELSAPITSRKGIEKELNRARSSGAVVWIVYAGGSRGDVLRPVRPLSGLRQLGKKGHKQQCFSCTCLLSDEPKEFALPKISELRAPKAADEGSDDGSAGSETTVQSEAVEQVDEPAAAAADVAAAAAGADPADAAADAKAAAAEKKREANRKKKVRQKANRAAKAAEEEAAAAAGGGGGADNAAAAAAADEALVDAAEAEVAAEKASRWRAGDGNSAHTTTSISAKEQHQIIFSGQVRRLPLRRAAARCSG